MTSSVQNERFSLQIKLLRFSGIPLDKESIWFNIYSYVVLGSILSAGIFALQDLMTNMDRMDTLIENFVFGGSLVMAFMKVLSIYLLRKRIGKTMTLLDNKIFIPNVARGREEEEELLSECMIFANGQGILMVVLTIIYMLRPNIETARLRILHSSNSSIWILPFGDISAFKNSQSPVYEAVWVYQSFANFMACISYSSVNVFTAAVMAFLSAQCKILQNFIKLSVQRSYSELMQQAHKKENNAHLEPLEVDWKHLQKALREIVEYHMIITDTTNEFENIFCIPTLIDFLGLSVIICLSLFYVTLVPGLNYLFLQMMTFTLGTTALQFMTSYWGNEVTVQYLEIGKACTEVDYIGTDTRFQKGLCIIIQRTQKPIHFTVGKFAPLTLNTFVTVIRAAYSCCMLLHNLGI